MHNTTNAPSNSATWKRGGIVTRTLDSSLLGAELYDVEPIRIGNAYPRQRNYHGYFWMSSTGQHVWHESLLERDCLMWLDFAGDIVSISSQPMKLTDSDGVFHYPDFLALDARGIQTVYDVKPASRVNQKARAQFAWTRDICKYVGWDYRVLTELAPQYKTNLTWLAQFRHHGHHPGAEDEQTVLDALQPGWTIDDVVNVMPAFSTAAARSRVFHLLWTRALTCDMNERMSNHTRISPAVPGSERKEYPHGNA